MLFPYFKYGTELLKNNPTGLIKPRAKRPNSKVNRDLNLGAKKWGIKAFDFEKNSKFQVIS